MSWRAVDRARTACGGADRTDRPQRDGRFDDVAAVRRGRATRGTPIAGRRKLSRSDDGRLATARRATATPPLSTMTSGSHVRASISTALRQPADHPTPQRSAAASPADDGTMQARSPTCRSPDGHIRSIAEPDAIASMHPVWPHAHSGPAGSMGMCPISPATKWAAASQATTFDVARGDARADAEIGEVRDSATGRGRRTSRRPAPPRARRSRRARRHRARSASRAPSSTPARRRCRR